MKKDTGYSSDIAFFFSNGIVWATLSMGIMLAGFVMPFLSVQNNISLSIYAASALLSLYVGMTISERLSSRIEKRHLILVGLLIFGFASIVSTATIDNIWWLVFLRFISGFGLSPLLVIIPEFVSENLSLLNKNRAMYFLDLFWPLGFFIGCVLTWLVSASIANPNAIYWFSGALSVVSFLVIAVWPNSRVAKVIADVGSNLEQSSEKGVTTSPKILNKQAVLNYSWILMNFIYYSMFLWAPLLLANRYNNPISLALGLISFGAIQLPSQALGNFLLSRTNPIKLFLISMAICIGCLLFISLFNSSNITILAWIVFAGSNMVGWAGLYPLTDTISPSTKSSERAQLLGKLAAVLGPVFFALLTTLTSSMDFAILGISAVCFILLFIVLLWYNGMKESVK